MKSNAIFVNISRGSTVDQEDLYDALVNKKIAKAGKKKIFCQNFFFFYLKFLKI